MKRLFVGFLCLVSYQSAFPQTVFISTDGGNWNVGTTWDQTGCTTGCVEGQDYPGPGDVAVIAVTSPASVSLPRSGSPSYSCKDLYVVNDVASSIRAGGFSGTPTLTIHGQISGLLNDLSDYAEPTVDVFHSSVSNLNIIFTGSALDDPISGAVITSWGHASPLYRITFNPGPGNVLRVDSHSIRNSSTVQTGTVQVNSNQVIRDATTAAQLIVASSSALRVFGAVNGDGTTSSRFAVVDLDGTITTETSGYVNAVNFDLGAGGVLNVGFSGVNQTQGWWYDTSIPSSLSISSTSSVHYNANASQTIYSTTYGNLSLSALSAATKTLSGAGLTLQGNLSVGSNVTFAPASQVNFTGTVAQAISGSGTLSFSGGLEVNKSAGTLTISKQISANGITVTAGTLDLGNVNTTLSSGNFLNAGTVTSGSAGTLTISGTSTFSGNGSLSLNHITVSGNAAFNNSAFTVTGNISNTGSLSVSATSTLTFSGGINQTISGNSFSLGNMVVNKTSSTLSNDGTVQLLGVLTMTTGTFDADGSGAGNFTLNSDTNGDAAVGPMSGGSITGELTFERYFDNIANSWRNIGFPVSSVTYSELGSSIQVANGSVATYTESALGDAGQGWNIVSSGTLNSALGHSAYMYNTGALTISVKGPLLHNVSSAYDFGVTYTDDPAQPSTQDGWNLMPNPYAAPINWNAGSGWTKTRLVAAAAIWDAQGGQYLYSNVSWDGVVAPGQAFWVQTNAANPSLISTESVKVTNSNPSFFRLKSNDDDSRLLITLSDPQKSDKALVQFRKGATDEFDPQYDATKLSNAIFNLSSISPNGLDLAANALSRSGCENTIKLKVTNIKPGKYQLKFDGVESFTDLQLITLVDHYTNTSKILAEGVSHSFSVDEDPGSFGSDRFELQFSFSDNSLNSPEITVSNRKLSSNYATGNQWYYNGEEIVGAMAESLVATKTGSYQLAVNVHGCRLLSAPVQIFPGSSRVFPNPAQDKMTLDLSGLSDSDGYIYIFNLFGEIVFKERFSALDVSRDIFVNEIKPGVHLLKVVSGDERVVMEDRIVIRR